MKVYGIPGWGCHENYFDFLKTVKTFNWHFYSSGSADPVAFLESINEDFIFICYSMGSLFIPTALENTYCKGVISLSGFLNFCGEGKLKSVLKNRISQMQTELESNTALTVSNFNSQAGRKREVVNPEFVNLNKGLNLLKDINNDPFQVTVPFLLLRGQKDRILHPKVAVQLERSYPNAEKHCVVDAPHDLSSSEVSIEHITQFIDEHS